MQIRIMIVLLVLVIATIIKADDKITKKSRPFIQESNEKPRINLENKTNMIIEQKKENQKEENINTQNSYNIEIFRFSFFGK